MKRHPHDIRFLLLIFFAMLLMSPFAFGEEGSWHYCQIQTAGMKPLKFRGSSLDEAMMRVTKACVDHQKDLYEGQRGELPQDRAEIFVESCVNLVQCARS